MSLRPPTRGLRIVQDGRTLIEDASCNSCTACTSQNDYWCTAPSAVGDPLGALDGTVPATWVRRWVTVLSALAVTGSGGDDLVLLLSRTPSDRAVDLVRTVHPGTVLATDGSNDASRAVLREASATGRAQVVVALQDARAAVRSVQRGGCVCAPDAPVALPTVTELVQRDVRLVGPSTLRPLTERGLWPTIVAGLESLVPVEAVHTEMTS